MLTSEVKQRINSCRDILVGKLPDPKSQVLQITNALIYKFMDDQDRQAEKLGGKPSFFVKELKPYAWHKLFDSKLTNQERADLYIEGMQKLSEAKHLPELFQEIFKEAYVPFRAAQTITLFISEINKFDYTHSEELGNAYEYLLSIMGSQGDAGQFRTPRHIIEFMVDVVDPKKGETIYDPACGTAGFLIAAYNHILEANGGKLKATERNTLAHNISGVDISPDMAKMARVNLYLHGFSTPVIDEGDTLSDEELWGKKHDVVLANPPFMSPKGGIIPHDLFGIKAKRAEVLFVDYIAEHLKLKGRAAIVVPEGVIFQSGTTYKALRKMLVEDGYLHSVISLPAGVFQPYSGVKTSILVLDRERAKESSEVLFLKIEKDGYSQSTQRTKLCDDNGDNPEWCEKHSDLPQALKIAKEWQKGKIKESPIASWVSKQEIADSGDYSLTGDRYRIFENISSDYPFVEVQELVETITPPGKVPQKDYKQKGLYPIIDQSIDYVGGYSDEEKLLVVPDKPLVIFGDHTCVLKLVMSQFIQGADGIKILKAKETVLPEYLYFILKYRPIESDGYKRHFSKLKKHKVPLPPIEVQREISAELDRYQKIIDGARQVIENYKPSFKIEPDWKKKKLDEVCAITSSKRIFKSDYVSAGIPFYRTKEVVELSKGEKISSELFISKKKFSEIKDKFGAPKKGDILLSAVGTIGVSIVVHNDEEFYFKDGNLLWLKDFEGVDSNYIKLLLDVTVQNNVKALTNGAAYNALTIVKLKDLEIPVPSLKTQKMLVKNIQEEQTLVQNNKILIKCFEQKIQDKISELWGE